MNNPFILKRAYAQAFAVFVAVIVSHYIAFAEKYWIVIAAFLVMQTAVGVTLRQGLQILLLLLMTVIVGTIIGDLILAVHPEMLYARVYDLMIGSVIGIFSNVFIFPVRPNVVFRNNLQPVLTLYSQSLSAFTLYLLRKDLEQQAIDKKIELDALLAAKSSAWVYHSGLSETLQPGYRHFLLMTERVGELLASLHILSRHSFDPQVLNMLEEPMTQFVVETNRIFHALGVVLALNKLDQPVSDLKEEWLTLDKIVNESSQDYIWLVSLVEDLKDLRITLISLGNSLQTAVRRIKN